jgi:hypothetical protein
MYFCDNYALAVAFCVVTMFCWGSWGNTQKGEQGRSLTLDKAVSIIPAFAR